jgi:hypothetical protein
MDKRNEMPLQQKTEGKEEHVYHRDRGELVQETFNL